MFIVYLIVCVLNEHNFGCKITEFNWDFQILGKKCVRRTEHCLDQVILLAHLQIISQISIGYGTPHLLT